jgi:hypothetical protein
MSHPYTIHKVLCASTPFVEDEKLAFLETLSRFCEEVSMQESLLYAPASFRAPFDPKIYKPAVDANIRICAGFLQLLDEEPAERIYKSFIEYALKCQADPAEPMRMVAVAFKQTSEVSPEAVAYKQSLDGRCDTFNYAAMEEFKEQVWQLLHRWHAIFREPGQ